jgi:PadR family transcriptional regulator AphA
MARINKSQYAILSCLTIHPMSAYEIKSFMEGSTHFFWTEREGQLYPTLKKLVEKGWVSYKEEAAAKNGTKKIYSSTESGIQAFNQWFCDKTSRSTNRNELLLKLFFAREQPIDQVIRMLKEALSDYEEEIALYHQIEQHLKERKQHVDTTFYKFTLDYGISVTEAEISWINETLNSLVIQ